MRHMTAYRDPSGPDEREIANASTTNATSGGGRRRAPDAGRPGMRAGQRYRPATTTTTTTTTTAATATPDTVPDGEAPLRASHLTASHPCVALGPVRLWSFGPPPQPAAVELADPYPGGLRRDWRLVFASHGPLVVGVPDVPGSLGALGPERRLVRLESGSVLPCEPSEPVRLSAGAAADAGSDQARALVLHVPEAALPLPGEVLRQVSGRAVPTGSGPAALLASFVHALAAHTPSAGARHAAWLGTAAVSLTTAFLDSEAALRQPNPSPTAAPSGTDVLLRGIKTYIEQHLREAELSPTSIAAANHISLRYLHHLFRREEHTVGAFLRARRLEHCRADLSDPAHAGRSVSEIARHWGFRDPAVFNRTFKSAYGLAPGAYRDQRLRPAR